MGVSGPMEGQTKPGLHKAADGTSTYFHPQQYELRKSEHKLFLLAQWLGHQPLTQNSCLYFLVCVSLGYCEKLLRDAGRMSMRMTLKHLRWVSYFSDENRDGAHPGCTQKKTLAPASWGWGMHDHSCTTKARPS